VEIHNNSLRFYSFFTTIGNGGKGILKNLTYKNPVQKDQDSLLFFTPPVFEIVSDVLFDLVH